MKQLAALAALLTARQGPEAVRWARADNQFRADADQIAAIEEWLARKTTSPMTGEELAHPHLTPNHVVRGLCRKYVDGES